MSQEHSIRAESSDANLNAFRMPFPNAFRTRASVSDSEHAPEGVLAAGALFDSVSLLLLVISNHPVTLGTPAAWLLTAKVALACLILSDPLQQMSVDALFFFFRSSPSNQDLLRA